MLEKINNFRVLNDRIWTGGQPSAAELSLLRGQGVESVINIAPYDDRYSIEDEPGVVKSLGMEYQYLPIDFKAPSVEHYHQLRELLQQNQNRKVFVHCAANYRVTVLLGNYAVSDLGWSCEERDEFIKSVWKVQDYPIWLELNNRLTALHGVGI